MIVRIGGEYRSARYRMSLIRAMDEYRQLPFPGARWCTREYKIIPLQRYCGANGIEFDSLAVGIAADESHRQPGKIRPLVDWGMTRDDCARTIASAGLPIPRRSGCWCCPFQTVAQWRELWETNRAKYIWLSWLERQASFAAGRTVTLRPDGDSLFTLANKFVSGQPEPFDMSEFYRPCMCRTYGG